MPVMADATPGPRCGPSAPVNTGTPCIFVVRRSACPRRPSGLSGRIPGQEMLVAFGPSGHRPQEIGQPIEILPDQGPINRVHYREALRTAHDGAGDIERG